MNICVCIYIEIIKWFWDAMVNLMNFLSFHNDRMVESPTRRFNPLLNTYSDYEDSVYSNCFLPLKV